MHRQHPIKQTNSTPATAADGWSARRRESFWESSDNNDVVDLSLSEHSGRVTQTSLSSGGNFFNAILGAALDLSLRSSSEHILEKLQKLDGSDRGVTTVNVATDNSNGLVLVDKNIDVANQQQWTTSERAKLVAQNKHLQTLLAAEVKQAGVVTTSGYKAVFNKFLYSDIVKQEIIIHRSAAAAAAADVAAEGKQRRRSSADSFQLFRRLGSGISSRRSSVFSNNDPIVSCHDDLLDMSFRKRCWGGSERRISSSGIRSSRRSSVTTMDGSILSSSCHDEVDGSSSRLWTSGMGRRFSVYSMGSTYFDDVEDDLNMNEYSTSNLAPRRPSHAASITQEELEALYQEGQPDAAAGHRQRQHRSMRPKSSPVKIVNVDFDPQDIISADNDEFDSSDLLNNVTTKERDFSSMYPTSMPADEEHLNKYVPGDIQQTSSVEYNDDLRDDTSSTFHPWPSKQQQEDNCSHTSSVISNTSQHASNVRPHDSKEDECGWLPWPSNTGLSIEDTISYCSSKSIGSCCTEDTTASFLGWPTNPHEFRRSGILQS